MIICNVYVPLKLVLFPLPSCWLVFVFSQSIHFYSALVLGIILEHLQWKLHISPSRKPPATANGDTRIWRCHGVIAGGRIISEIDAR